MKESLYGWYPPAAEVRKSRQRDRDSYANENLSYRCKSDFSQHSNVHDLTAATGARGGDGGCDASGDRPSPSNVTDRTPSAAAAGSDNSAADAAELTSLETLKPHHEHHHHQCQQQQHPERSSRRHATSGRFTKLWADRLPETTCSIYTHSSPAGITQRQQLYPPCKQAQRCPTGGTTGRVFADSKSAPPVQHQYSDDERPPASKFNGGDTALANRYCAAAAADDVAEEEDPGVHAAVTDSVTKTTSSMRRVAAADDDDRSAVAAAGAAAPIGLVQRLPCSAVNIDRTPQANLTMTTQRLVKSAAPCRRQVPRSAKEAWTAGSETAATAAAVTQDQDDPDGVEVRWRFRHRPKAPAPPRPLSSREEMLGVEFPLNYDAQLKKHGWKMEIPGDPLNFKRPCIAKRRPTSVQCVVPTVAPFAPAQHRGSAETFFYSTVHRRPLSFAIHPDWDSEILVGRRVPLQKRPSGGNGIRYTDFSFVY